MIPLYQIVTDGYGRIQVIAGEAEVIAEYEAKTEDQTARAMDLAIEAITAHNDLHG